MKIFNNRNKNLFIIFGIIVLLVIIAVPTYAYFSARVSGVGNRNFLTVGGIDLSLTETTINVSELEPIYDSERATKASKNTFSLTANNNGCLTIKLDIDSIQSKFAETNALKWEIYNITDSTSVSTGDFSNTSSGDIIVLAQNISLTKNVSKQFELRIWLSFSTLINHGNLLINNSGSALEAHFVFEAFSGTCVDNLAYNYLDTSKANAPALDENMIPVVYDETLGVWKKAPESQVGWYNYDAKAWANAVTVTSTNRSTYMSAAVGTTIPINDINAFFVWIPRYEYYINGAYAGGSAASPHAIGIKFVSGINTTATPNYRIHSAFRDGTKNKNSVNFDLGGWTEEITGFWAAKFETGGTQSTSCTTVTCNISNIEIVPDVASLGVQSLSSMFFISRSLSGYASNPFGLAATLDTHLMKNDEWGAITYLTQSTYGKCTSPSNCTETYINNSSSRYTGRSGGNVSGNTAINTVYLSQSSTTQNNEYGFYTYDGYLLEYSSNVKSITKDLSKVASTTGNIYGVYDMVGGQEYVFSNYDSNIGSSGLSGFPDSNYWNKYVSDNVLSACNGVCYGHALSETSGWYNASSSFISSSFPFLVRSSSMEYSYGAGNASPIRFRVAAISGSNVEETQYGIIMLVENGSVVGQSTKVASDGDSVTFATTINSGYDAVDKTLTCTNGQTATLNGTTVTVSNITNSSVCKLTYSYAYFDVLLTSTTANISAPVTQSIFRYNSATFTVSAKTDYALLGTVACDNGHTGSLSGSTVTINNITTDTTCTLTLIKAVNTFDYLATAQTYTVPVTGTYKLEVWGAQGANYSSTYTGGLGGYISGTVVLSQNDVLTIQTGGQDGTNGGGTSTGTTSYNGGGGTTIIRNNVTLITGAGGGGGSARADGTNGGSGTAAGGTSAGNGTGTAGTNGGGGSSSRTYSYDCYCTSTCYYCGAGFYCPNGGTPPSIYDDTNQCTGSNYVLDTSQYHTCSCQNGFVVVTGLGPCVGNCSEPCAAGYTAGTASLIENTCSQYYAGTYACTMGVSIPNCYRRWNNTCSWNGNYTASCDNFYSTYDCDCETCTTKGYPGQGGTSSVGTGVTQTTKTDGNKSGNGNAKITLCVSGICS